VARGEPAVAGWPGRNGGITRTLRRAVPDCGGAAAEHSLLGLLVGQETNSAHAQGYTEVSRWNCNQESMHVFA